MKYQYFVIDQYTLSFGAYSAESSASEGPRLVVDDVRRDAGLYMRSMQMSVFRRCGLSCGKESCARNPGEASKSRIQRKRAFIIFASRVER